MKKQMITDVIPHRIQRKRTRGWKMPKNTVYVGRPGKWGNMFSLKGRQETPEQRKFVLDCYRLELLSEITFNPLFLEPLRGKNLACWCPLDKPCHADILLTLANEGRATQNKI